MLLAKVYGGGVQKLMIEISETLKWCSIGGSLTMKSLL